jgi:rhamnose utilization protein RhaD (predicted bifunctional aldolase and dehydrogenase)
MNDNLVKLARIFGGSSRNVQAGGGNISEKRGDKMYIKASGIHLSQVSENYGLSAVAYTELEDYVIRSIGLGVSLDILEEKVSKSSLNDFKPSIETSMHLVLAKYVVHTHDEAYLRLFVSKDYKRIKEDIISSVDCAFVPYVKPGVELTKSILSIKNNRIPAILFLENHGIVFHANKADKLFENYYKCISILNKYLIDESLNYWLNFQRKIFLKNNQNVRYFESRYLSKYVEILPKLEKNVICPDQAVYINKVYTKEDEYLSKGIEFDILCYKSTVIIAANTWKKFKEIEELIMVLIEVINNASNLQTLDASDTERLRNWSLEKHRQEI